MKANDGVKLLKEKGGLKHIVKLLNRPNEKILNVALSILANCCLQEDCREFVSNLLNAGYILFQAIYLL